MFVILLWRSKAILVAVYATMSLVLTVRLERFKFRISYVTTPGPNFERLVLGCIEADFCK